MNNTNNYNMPADLDNEFWAQVKEAKERGTPEDRMILSLLGERGEHIFAAGYWISCELRKMDVLSDETIGVIAFNSGRLMAMHPDPWEIAVKVLEQVKAEQAKTSEKPEQEAEAT